MSRFFLKTAVIIAMIAGILFLYQLIDSQFRYENIHDASLNNQIASDQPLIPNEIEHILSEPFRYLDRGRQSFVFVSQDGHYVIKFFDLRRYKPNVLQKIGLLSQARKIRKKDRLFRGYKLAYERDRDYAQIIYQQLYPNPHIKQSLIVYDRFGFKHHIDLSRVPFVIQYKAVPTRVEISNLLNQGKVEEAKNRLRALLDMYMVEYKRGLYDRDHNFMYNTGFVDGKPMRLDVGRLRADDRFKEKSVALEDLKKVAIDRTEGWLGRHFPQFREVIMTDINSKMRELEKS